MQSLYLKTYPAVDDARCPGLYADAARMMGNTMLKTESRGIQENGTDCNGR